MMRVLYVEDNPVDADLARRSLLRYNGDWIVEIVPTLKAARALLVEADRFDLLLSDLDLPDGNGMDLVGEVRERRLNLAVVVLTRSGDERTAVAALKAGANDYVAKRTDYTAHLGGTLVAALVRFRAEKLISAGPLRVLYAEHHALDADLTRRHLAQSASRMRLEVVATAAEALARLPASVSVAANYDVVLVDYCLPGDNGLDLLKEIRTTRGLTVPVILVTGQGDAEVAVQAMRLGASDYLVKHTGYLHALPAVLAGAHHRSQLSLEIAARTLTEEELRWRTALFEAQLDTTLEGILVVDSTGRKIYQNRRMAEVWKIPPEIAADKADARQVQFVTTRVKHPQQFAEKVTYLYAHPAETSRDEIELIDGTILDRYSAPVRDKAENHYGRIWTFRDITEQRQLEGQLRQSQKMEAIGQLSGGVAHDFNNLLTVIKGHIGLMRMSGQVTAEITEPIQQIDEAADRAAKLTAQLLMFSRQQVMKQSDHNLNDLVGNLTTMLRRLVSENIKIVVDCAPDVLAIRGDEGMVEQVLLNLVVNARDAMPKGGTLTVETGVVTITEGAMHFGPQARAGIFVYLAVSDTGTGIDPEVLPRIFDPFFTTKGIGKGTGLGLATVYGAVQQHGGWVKVESELGRGSVFRVYFPRLAGAGAGSQVAQPTTVVRGGHEGILLVEDEPAVRRVAVAALESLGYRIFIAPSGLAALPVWAENQAKIDLLLTDLVMPDGLSGLELATRLQESNPWLPVVFMSGYSHDVVAGGDVVLKEGTNYLTKPFDLTSLAKIVRTSLDEGTKRPAIPPGPAR